MLKTIDIFIGLSLVMLLVSMIVTVITQAFTNIVNSRGTKLMEGIAGLLTQLHPGINQQIAEEISTKVLSHPLVSDGKLAAVIHREELTKLLLELGSGDLQDKQKLSADAQSALEDALIANGICAGPKANVQAQIREKLANIRSLALHLELTHPELANAARARVAFLQQANSQFLAKINLWFDQTMDRVSERFTTHTRYVTFVAGLLVALVLQLDTAALVSRLSTDPDLRNSLVAIAQKQDEEAKQKAAAAQKNAAGQRATDQSATNQTATNQTATNQTATSQTTPAPGNPAGPPASQTGQDTKQNATAAVTNNAASVITLSDADRDNLKDLMVNNVVGIPQGWGDWVRRWHKDNWFMKSVGILLTAFLLSLGAPFWYGALQNLLRLRSLLATKDDQQRQDRQAPSASTPQLGAPDGVVLTDERGDLAVVA